MSAPTHPWTGRAIVLVACALVAAVLYEYVTGLRWAMSAAARALGLPSEMTSGAFLFAYMVSIPCLPLAALGAWSLLSRRRDRRAIEALEASVLAGRPDATAHVVQALGGALGEDDAPRVRRLHALLERALGERTSAGRGALAAAVKAYLDAAGHGDGAFHGDAWAQVSRVERRDAARAALDDVRRNMQSANR